MNTNGQSWDAKIAHTPELMFGDDRMVNTTGIKCITLSIDDTPETEYKVFAHYKIENSLLTLKKVLHADGCKIYPETIIDDNPQHDLARHQIEAIIEEITKEEGL